MAIPTENTSLADFFEQLLFTAAYMKGTKGFADFAKRLLAARKATADAIAARNEAKDELVLANVAQALAWEEMQAPLMSFETQVKAALEPDIKAFKAVFPVSSLAVMRSAEIARPAVMKSIVEFAGRRGHTGRLEKSATAVLTAWKAYQEVTKEVVAAEKALSAAVAEVAKAKRAGVIAMREADGHLRIKYADDLATARKFFLGKKKATAKNAKGKDAGAPSGGVQGGPRPAEE